MLVREKKMFIESERNGSKLKIIEKVRKESGDENEKKKK